MASRPITSTSTTFGAAAVTVAAAAPLGARRVRVECTQDCYITLGTPLLVATSANGVLLRSPTYGQEFGVCVGDQISVIQSTAGGILNVTFVGEA